MSAERAQITAGATLDLERLRALDLTTLESDHVALLREMVIDAKREQAREYEAIVAATEAELIRRIKEAGGRALPSWEFARIDLEDVHTAYAFNDTRLREVMGQLSSTDAEKIGKVIPAHVEQVPERFLRGNTASIQALVRKYGPDSEVGRALASAMTRERVGEKLVIRRNAPDAGVIAGSAV